eukprot:170375-Pelagomonas_calceolata.AAC.4
MDKCLSSHPITFVKALHILSGCQSPVISCVGTECHRKVTRFTRFTRISLQSRSAQESYRKVTGKRRPPVKKVDC